MARDIDPAERLQTLINSGRYRLPLCHTHALEIIAAMHGANDWPSMSAGSDAVAGKAQAKALRAHFGTGVTVPLSMDDAKDAVAALSAPPIKIETKTAFPPIEQISFKRQPWGKHEWQIENPKRLMSEALDELLERGEDDSRFMERKGEAMLGRFPGDLDLIHSVAVAKWQLGKATQAAALWSRAWDLVREPMDAMVGQDAKAKVSYSALENRPFYRIFHGHITSLASKKTGPELKEAIRLSGMAFRLSRDRDGLGFRMLHVGYLADDRQWEELVRFVDHMDKGNAGCFDVSVFRAAAAAKLGHPDAGGRFQAIVEKSPFATEVLANAVPVPNWGDGIGVSLGSWQEGAEVIQQHAEVWQDPQLRELWKGLRHDMLEAQMRRVREIQKAQAHFKDPERTREYVGDLRTPFYGGLVPLLEAEWEALWPDLAPSAKRKR